MRIGIVTWHKGNIGGTLQAYALSEVLKKLGYDTVLLNFIEKRCDPVIRKIRNVLFHICFMKSGLTRDNTYKFIREHVKESPDLLYDELAEYSSDLDAVICGSDQIWSCVNCVNPVYFLQFVPEEKRIAYAPSIGLNGIKKEFEDDFIKYVKSIPYLSVREKKGAEIIKELTNLSPKVVLDPTLLLKREEWLSIASNITVNRFGLKKNEYILCYYLGNPEKYSDYTKRISKRTQKRVIYVSFKRKRFGINQVICTIEEFIALVRDSYCVLTDSFHGTVIPINLGKKAAVFERFSENDPMNQNSRIYNVLSKLSIENWIAHPDEDESILIQRSDDVQKIQELLEIERNDSLAYLKNSLSSVCL